MEQIKVIDDKAAPSYTALLFVSCAISFGCFFASYMRLPVLPLYARSLDIPTAEIGIINSAFFLMAQACCLCLRGCSLTVWDANG